MGGPSLDDLQLADFDITGGRALVYLDDGRVGFQPRLDLPAHVLEIPMDWDVDPFSDRNWRFQLSAWRMLDGLWREQRDQGASDVAARVMHYVRDWHRFHILRQRCSEFCWDDMATGLRSQHLAWLLLQQRRHGILPPQDAVLLDQLAELHYAKLISPGFISTNNHGIFQAHALRLLEIVLGKSKGKESAAEKAMATILDEQFDEEGVHREGAPFYHFFAERRFRKVRPALYPALGERMELKLGRAKAVTPWLVMPNGEFAAVGDSEGRYPSRIRLPKQMAAGTDGHGFPVYANAMLKSGYVSIRSAPTVDDPLAYMLFFTGMALGGKRHDHADALSFELYANGGPMLVDGGKYGYEADAWRAYFVSDLAHNGIGRSGRSYLPEDAVVSGSCLERYLIEDGVHLMEGGLVRPDGFSIRRRLAFLPGRQLEIFDHTAGLEAGESAELRFHFHERCRVEPSEGAADGLDVFAGGRRIARMQLPSALDGVSIHRGQQGERLGWRSPSYRKVTPISTVVVRCRAGSAHTRLMLEPPVQIDG
jgi:hypothetical protein